MVPMDDGAESKPIAVAVCTLLGEAGFSNFCAPDPAIYESSKGEPAIVATHGSDSGWLYPLANTFFVEKPASCVPHEDIACYELLEGQSRGQLLLHLKAAGAGAKGGKAAKLEFGFAKVEAGRLRSYLSKSGIKVNFQSC